MSTDCWFDEEGCAGTASGQIEATIGGMMKRILPACGNCAKAYGCDVDSDDGSLEGSDA